MSNITVKSVNSNDYTFVAVLDSATNSTKQTCLKKLNSLNALLGYAFHVGSTKS